MMTLLWVRAAQSRDDMQITTRAQMKAQMEMHGLITEDLVNMSNVKEDQLLFTLMIWIHVYSQVHMATIQECMRWKTVHK